MIQDAWFTVQKIADNTFAISEYGHWEKVHSFLVIGEHKAALIDTGLGIDNIKRITDQLTRKPIEVVTTHVHTDHIGSHGEYDTIHVHEADQDWLIHGIEGLTLAQIRKDIARDITLPTPATFHPDTYTPFQGYPTNVLKDGDMIELGNRQLIIYHTPGHSPGHIVLYDTTQGYLFTGDLLYDQTPIYAFYPSTNPVDLVMSLEKISNIDGVKKVFGSHNTLGLDASILQEVKQAVTYLRENSLAKFGTGIHEFNGFRIQF
ncbi:MBL fold metallo-hydrolase [Virgibacillus dokdonensis]|uniref:MBL fold metallo-hydrolase n=1 Tax=Virgibacillus dokdonensis TaxID=302167 RepID=A0A3E0WQT1_9BACI|nr:MBL fold metallo-hydrolase [Virgibacillus dokdonensis]RFA34346.1 MBL fold metallo-hydrolase [Virgibacillus dokdonensis]